jgi:predicted amidohydrolase YtcJ
MNDVARPIHSRQRGTPANTFADLVLRDALVYTADQRQSWAEAVAIRKGTIVYVGSTDGLRPFVGPETQVRELPGRLILPGFRDAHIHPLTGSLNLFECRLIGSADPRAYLSQVAVYARANEDQPFIRGGGWLPDAFPDCGPHRSDLDAIVADRPVLLKSIDGHSAWINTRALELAGITADTANPPGGLIERDPRSGKPTGTLREWSAMDLVASRFPPPTLADRVTAGWAFMEMAARLGIVSIHEAMAKEDELAAYRALDQSGELTLRVQAALLCEPEKGRDQIEDLLALRQTYQGGLLAPRTVKIFVDGVVEGHTAWLIDSYADRPGFCGERLWSPEELNGMAAALDRAGFQLHLHAVGDGAVRMALDAFEHVALVNGHRDRRPMIAHCDLIDPVDLPRFHSLGVVANLQPLWFYAERNFRKMTLTFLGSERAWRLYPMQSLLTSGAAVTCGTDWPFSGELNTFNPLMAIQVGVTRRGLDADAAPVYAPEQCVSLTALIDAHTSGGAYADFQEHLTGTLTVGKSADLICLDRNIFALPPSEISQARILLTIFQGKQVYQAPFNG